MPVVQKVLAKGNLVLIERMTDGEKALLDEAEALPRGYTLVMRRYGVSPYDSHGQIKKMYKNLPVLSADHVDKPGVSLFNIGNWEPGIRYFVIQNVITKDYFLREASARIPDDYVKVNKYNRRNCYYDGELTAACQELPVLMVM